jgi:hypothetical protein
LPFLITRFKADSGTPVTLAISGSVLCDIFILYSTLPEIAKVTGVPESALKRVIKKGKGAYYSSGSRPNQTAHSWAYARLASVLMNGPARKYDNIIWIKYKI